MKRALLYLLLWVVLNLFGDFIIHVCFEPYHEVSNFSNYIIVFIISVFYYCLTLPDLRFLRLFLIPIIFLSLSIFIIFLGLLGQELEGADEILYFTTSLICSLFESINLIIGEVNNDLTRKCLFFIFNSLGVSLILLGIAAIVDYLNNSIKLEFKKS